MATRYKSAWDKHTHSACLPQTCVYCRQMAHPLPLSRVLREAKTKPRLGKHSNRKLRAVITSLLNHVEGLERRAKQAEGLVVPVVDYGIIEKVKGGKL